MAGTQNSVMQSLSTNDPNVESDGMPILAVQTTNNQEQHQFIAYSNNPEDVSEAISPSINQQQNTNTSGTVSSCRDHNKDGTSPVFPNGECPQEKKRSPPSSSGNPVQLVSSSEYDQHLCCIVSNAEERSNEGNPLEKSSTSSDTLAICDEDNAKVNSHFVPCSPTPSLPSTSRSKASSLLESNQSLLLTNEKSEKWHPFKIDPPNPEMSPLTQRLVIANNKVDEESVKQSHMNEEKNLQSNHTAHPLGSVDDSEFSDKMKSTCKEDNSYSETELQCRVYTNCENAKEQVCCSEDNSDPDSDGLSSLMNRQLYPLDDEVTTESTPTTIARSSEDLTVQKQSSADLECKSLSSSTSIEYIKNLKPPLESVIGQGAALGEINLFVQYHRKKISNGKTLSQYNQKTPLNTNRNDAAMMGPSLLEEAILSLRCTPLILSCRAGVAEGMMISPNACLLRSREYTTHWGVSIMTTACTMKGLFFLKGEWKVTSKSVLFLGGCEVSQQWSIAMQHKFQGVPITAYNKNNLLENWTHLPNSRNNMKHSLMNRQHGSIPSNRGNTAETKPFSVQCSRAPIVGEHCTHTAVERRTLLTGGKQQMNSTAKTSLRKITCLPNVWYRQYQITSNSGKRIIISEKRLSLYALYIFKVLHDSDSFVHWFIQVTVYEQNDLTAIRGCFTEVSSKFPELSLPHSLLQQREIDHYICFDDTTAGQSQSHSDSESDSNDGNHSNNGNQYGDHHNNNDDDDANGHDDGGGGHNNNNNNGGGGDGNHNGNGGDDNNDDDEDDENDDEDVHHPQQVEIDYFDEDDELAVPINATDHGLSNSAYVTHHPSPLPLLSSVSAASSSQKTVFTKSDLKKIPKVIPIQPQVDTIVAPNHGICGTQSCMVTGATTSTQRAGLSTRECTGTIQLSRGQPTIPGILCNIPEHFPCENGIHTQQLQVLTSREEQGTEQFHVVGFVQEQSSEQFIVHEINEFLQQDHSVPTQQPQENCEDSLMSNHEQFIYDGPIEEEGAEEV